MTATVIAGSDVPPDDAAWADVGAARAALEASRAGVVAAELTAQRSLVDFLFAVHPDTAARGAGLDDRGRPVLWCAPEEFVRGLSRSTRIELAKIADKSQAAAMRDAVKALTVWCVMAHTAARLESGDLPATRLWLLHRERQGVPDDELERFDELVGAIPAGLEWRAFRKAVADAAASLREDEPKLTEHHHKARNVSMRNNGDGSATLFATGPVQTVTAGMRRMQGLARAIARGGDAAVNGQVPEGRGIADDRTVDQLVFDLWMNARHGLDVRTEPIRDDDGSTGAAGGVGGADAPDSTALVHVRVPLESDWLGRQAGVMVTVPVLTLLGLSDLPGKMDDASPVPAGLARLIAGSAGSFFRMLTDPLSGRGLEYPSESYPIPAAFRRTVAAVWAWCSTPGCNRRAETCEVDHVEPFNHDDPRAGGLTELANLQPLCKGCHQAKTDKRLGVTRRYLPANPTGEAPGELNGNPPASGADAQFGSPAEDPAAGLVGRSASPVPVTEWVFPSRVAGCVVPPADGLAVRHAAEVKELIDFQVRWLLSRELSRLDGTDGAGCAGGGASPEALTAAAHDFFDAEDSESDAADRDPNAAVPGPGGIAGPRVPGVPDLPAFRGVESIEDLLTGEDLLEIIRQVTDWNTDGRCDDPYGTFTTEILEARRAARVEADRLEEVVAMGRGEEITEEDDFFAYAQLPEWDLPPEEWGLSLDEYWDTLRPDDDTDHPDDDADLVTDLGFGRVVSTEELGEFLESGEVDMEAFLETRAAGRPGQAEVELPRDFRHRRPGRSRFSTPPAPAPWLADPDSPWRGSDDPPPF